MMATKDKERAAFSPSNPCEVTITIYSPAKSKLDPPNLYPTVKALVDGMTDAGLWRDDNHEIIKYMTFEFGGLSQIKDKYKIEIEVEEIR